MKFLYQLVVLVVSFLLTTEHSFAGLYPNDRSELDSTIQPFYHGVASGDPLNDRVIIWTRVTTDQASVSVKWRMATDTGMQNIIGQGTVSTDETKDYTLKVDVAGLQPNTYYYYEFEALGRLSQRGRTKTMPTGDVSSLRIAFMSCSNYSFGYFNTYDIIKKQNDVDLLIHLGDYIYEDGFKINGVDTVHRRTFPEYDAFDLASYRLRYAWYRLDPSTRNLHQQYPMVVIWDDHEFANDATKDTALRHNPATQGPWSVRKANAIRVYKEWIPMREDTSNTNIINFTQRIGNLADIIYTENRIERIDANDFQQAYDLLSHIDNLQYDTPNRTMHGFRQMEWMSQELKKSTATWKILANQVVFASYVYKQAILGIPFPFHNAAGWDINPLDRKKIIDTINHYSIKNLVILSGDIHTAMAFDVPGGVVPYNPTTGVGSIGVEFVSDNITSGNILGGQESYMYANNSHLKYVNSKSAGYCVLDVTPTSVCCDFWQTDIYGLLSDTKTLLGTWCTIKDQNHLKPYIGPTFTPRVFPALVPYSPRNNGLSVGVKNKQQIIEIMSLFPNPTQHYLRFQYFVKNPELFNAVIYDVLGNEIQQIDLGYKQKGLNEDAIDISQLASGNYIISFITSNGTVSRKFVKN
ncbi:MAG TPA: alkaline phosphatase D family protein [Chitinophagales bacterium]|jgi:alkaline phosphatase D|nr:alkaline phosphatase D family protein [Chitinophagales bacterium]HQW80037.1 alkaline phosphatase D family protein [Chitinophagales bacterium]HRB18594.1 alkaline phosphatase D family protein [Chitinophagales bacterium]HRB66471.1 alkaline phosphatase D family protein [Chitinophagales bacterium]HRB68698.1 alkaline phosphatase D family protein [Chitinophagales bacterium]